MAGHAMTAWRANIALFFSIAVTQSIVLTAPHIAKSSEVGANSLGTAEGTIDQKAKMPAGPNVAEPKVFGNPLLAISLDQLSSTRQRPLFSPTRRPPPAVAVAPLAAAPVLIPPPPERPQLTLVGTVVGEQDGIGVFVEQSTQKVFRLKIGEAHEGWTLRSIRRRAVDLEKDGRLVVVEMPSIAPILPQPSSSPTRLLKRVGN
jgi:hypothetical protein